MNANQIKKLISQEVKRQEESLVMIASENYASPATLAALGSPLSNKYAEGYPGRRYYTGNEIIDDIESACQALALQVFGLNGKKWHANVQPHSGSTANQAAYFGLLKPGATILALDLSAGGHLTHGSKVSITGQLFNFVHYNVDPRTHRLDYTAIANLAKKVKPAIIVCGATAYPRSIDFKKFSAIAKSVGAILLADIAHIAGLVAGGVHSSPFPYADVVTMTTHKTLGGPRGAIIICRTEYAAAIDKAVFPGLQGGPAEHVIAAKAISLAENLTPKNKARQKQTVINAKALADTLITNGLTLITGGTDNHLLIIDCSNLSIKGKDGADLLASAGISANANMIPYESRSPRDPSGIRLGTAALTTRGMKAKEMKLIGNWIATILQNPEDKELLTSISREVKQLTKHFPIYL